MNVDAQPASLARFLLSAGGDHHLKALVQWAAASAAGLDVMEYYAFEDPKRAPPEDKKHPRPHPLMFALLTFTTWGHSAC